ncbi:MAG: hypothetical protein HZB65_01420 [Candidatus Aenigmarchaeota archaeon]|nr:hypothetical protein [Candidatus Aenigmarchaeota archaeon]
MEHDSKESIKNLLDDPGFAIVVAYTAALTILASDYLIQGSIIAKEVDNFISGMYPF